MSLFDPRVFGAIILALVLSSAGSYFYGRSDGRKIERAVAQVEIDNWQQNANAAHELYLKARDEKEIRYRTITKTVEIAKHATPDIPDCRTGNDWMRIYRDNAAVANGAPMPADTGSPDRADAR